MWKKILAVFVITFCVVILGVYVFVSTQGRRIFNEQASALTNRKVAVDSIRPLFPNGLELKGVAVEDLVTVRRVRVRVDILAICQGRVRIISVELEKPILFLERGADASLQLPEASSPGKTETAQAAAAPETAQTAVKPAPHTPVIVRALVVRDGVVQFKDLKSGRVSVVSEVQGTIKDLPLTNDPARTEVSVTASLAQLSVPFLGHSLKAQGWLNWAARDMDMTAQSVDDNGRVGLDVKLVSRANDLSVKGKVLLIGSQQKQASGKRSGMLESVVLSALTGSSTDIEANFSFKSTMDRFDVSKVSLSGVVNTGLNSGGSSGSIVDSLKAVGEELLKDGDPSTTVKP